MNSVGALTYVLTRFPPRPGCQCDQAPHREDCPLGEWHEAMLTLESLRELLEDRHVMAVVDVGPRR